MSKTNIKLFKLRLFIYISLLKMLFHYIKNLYFIVLLWYVVLYCKTYYITCYFV